MSAVSLHSADSGRTPGLEDADLIQMPVVRELLIENEQLMCEAAAFRRLRAAVATDGPTRFFLEEQAARGTVALEEARCRCAAGLAMGSTFLGYIASLEDALAEEQDRREQVKGYMAAARQSLAPRPGGRDGTEAVEEDVVSRRLSMLSVEKENTSPRGVEKRRASALADRTNASPAAKRVRLSVDSSGRKTQPSPSEITKDRKTLHEADLAVDPCRRKVVGAQRYAGQVAKKS